MTNYDNKGLTLVELIVVIGALALILSMAIPKIQKNSYILLSISRTMRDDIRSIRYLTMAEGKNYKILFQKYSYVIIEGTKIKKEVKINKGYSIAQNFKDSEIAFNYNGSPTTSGGTVNIFDVDTNKYCQITVIPDTGRILLKNKIFDGHSGKK